MDSSSMNDLIQRLTNAIIRQEGMAPDYKNPGNLRYAPWMTKPVIVKGFWQPNSREEGIAGAAHVVALRVAMGQSLKQLIGAWAPPSDGNDTHLYIVNVAKWTNIDDINRPLWGYICQSSVTT